jgi:uncharacterized membrane protein YidH (DUF202 family)
MHANLAIFSLSAFFTLLAGIALWLGLPRYSQVPTIEDTEHVHPVEILICFGVMMAIFAIISLLFVFEH